YRGASWGKRLALLFEELVEPDLWGPTLIHEYPVEVSPLAQRSPDAPRFRARYELYLGGFELANGFSELNDPDEQRRRFEEQVEARQAGHEEGNTVDGDTSNPPEAG